VRTFPIALLVAACSSHPGNPSNPIDGPTDTTDGNGSGSGSGSGSGMMPNNATVFTILFENHDYKEIVSSGSGSPGAMNAPYINSLIAQYGLATNYKDTNHPSTPNYLHLISGSDQYPGVFDELPTYAVYFPTTNPSIATQFQAAGIKWRSYSEDVGSAGCGLANSGEYAPRHTPFLYFKDIQDGSNGLCAETNVDYGLFAADLASSSYRYMWLTPNLLDDGHDPSADPVTGLKQSDTWLSQQRRSRSNSDDRDLAAPQAGRHDREHRAHALGIHRDDRRSIRALAARHRHELADADGLLQLKLPSSRHERLLSSRHADHACTQLAREPCRVGPSAHRCARDAGRGRA
jgi:hypothetical protein